jgi:hypothetical protein
MAQMMLTGPIVTLLDSAAQQVQGLEAEIARLSARRDELQRAFEQGIREAIQSKGYELPEHWKAQPTAHGLQVVWDDEEIPM